ncbi:MAG: amidohydrolase, partial [Ignavibacteriae bacterium]|nr:amidohydrolase [Ignavibacteriota bacterium]
MKNSPYGQKRLHLTNEHCIFQLRDVFSLTHCKKEITAIGSERNIPVQLRSLFSENLREQLIGLRRDIHRHPELSFQEERTAKLLYDELQKLHPHRLEILNKTAVVATIAGKNQKAPAVALRADIDALPIQEATGLEYSSVNSGVMHACGHDVHAAWGFGAASLLAHKPAEGPVVMIFQPAEEIGKGALAVIEAGALEGVSA